MVRKKTTRTMGTGQAEAPEASETQDGLTDKPERPGSDARSVNCFAIGGGFLDYCVKQGWLIRNRHGKSTRYYVTEVGRSALADFGITKY